MLLFIGLIGCSGGGPAVSVTGQVTYKGAPVTGGIISFQMDGGKKIDGSIDANGKYTMTMDKGGKATIAVETESIKSSMPGQSDIPADMKGKIPGETSKLGSTMPAYVKIPAKYADPKTSGLSMDVKSGSQSKNWDLTD